MDSDRIIELLQKLFRQIHTRDRHWPQAPRLTPAEQGFLWSLWRHGTISHSRLAEILGVSRSMTSIVIRRLIELDLVSQSVDASDHRRRILGLTESGKKLLEERRMARQSEMAARLDRLSSEDREALERILDHLVNDKE